MVELDVSIERRGVQISVGKIIGESHLDARFKYNEDYLSDTDAIPISVSLPLQEQFFSVVTTRTFFEGLLPEGFSRRALAINMHEDEDDYIAILKELGSECLGAIQILDGSDRIYKNEYRELSLDRIKELAKEGATKSTDLLIETHLSLTGASGKVGVYSNDDGKTWYLPVGCAPSTHILKQSHVRLNDIVVNEQLVLLAAKKLGIDVVDSKIIDTGSKRDDAILFSTKRYDRIINLDSQLIGNLPCPLRLHQEDFSQALGIPSKLKYEKANKGYMRLIFDLIRHVSSNPIEDQLKLWDRVVYNYLIGNTDAHIKNYSLLYNSDLNSVRLSPAYDMISTIIYKESTKSMSFSVGGEYIIDNITDEHFRRALKDVHLGERLAMDRYYNIKDRVGSAIKEAGEELAASGYDNAAILADKIAAFPQITKKKDTI